MKTSVILMFFFFNLSFSVFAQKLISPAEERRIIENSEFGNFIEVQTPVSVFKIPENKKEWQGANQIFIEQIGDRNFINAVHSSEYTDLKLLQFGNENYISFMVDARNLEGSIVQEGDNNNSFDFTLNPSQDITTNLIQRGNALHFERYGANSIGNGLKFIQTGDTKSIIIRNFQ